MRKFIPTLFWLTGLSGAGKTTLSVSLTKRLREWGHPVIFLDGDILRELYNNRFGYDHQGRLEASLQYARLCKMLTDQDVHVVCATISLFHQVQHWNREKIKNYIEIFIDVSLPELIIRDNKNIYSRALDGELTNVVGIDIKPEFPKQSDIIIQNPFNTIIDDNVNLIVETYDKKIQSREQTHASDMELYQTS